MKRLLFLFILLYASAAFAQQERDSIRDYKWMIGKLRSNTVPWAGQILGDFTATDTIFRDYPTLDTFRRRETNASITDSAGNILFYTNGILVKNRENNVIAGWDTLGKNHWSHAWFTIGFPLPQAALILPAVDNDSIYYLVHSRLMVFGTDTILVCTDALFYTVINMNADSGRGAIIELNVPLILDTLDYGKITACRHANGRDWWITVPIYNSKSVYLVLLNQTGLNVIGEKGSTNVLMDGLGQAVFSPNGMYYCISQKYNFYEPHKLLVYEFNRCEGSLTEVDEVDMVDTATCSGLAISPNSRYAYVMSHTRIYQFDITAPDIAATKTTVAVWDGFIEDSVFATTFYLAQLAPNGKIYIGSTNSTHYLHVIENPDLGGLACNVVQRGAVLPNRNFTSVPNFPNFRLGPIDGSPCDTLGYNDIFPVALQEQRLCPVYDLQLWPNPARHYTHIYLGATLRQPGSLQVFSASGSLVFEVQLQTATLGYTLSTSKFSAGSYTLLVKEGSTLIGQSRLVIQ